MNHRSAYHYSRDELFDLGVQAVGENVLVDRTCRLYGADRISFGSHVRVDAQAVLSAGEGGIEVGDHVHLSCGVIFVGGGGVFIEDFANLSVRVTVFTANDDYSGESLAGTMVPDYLRRVTVAPVIFRKHSLIGSGSIVLPGVTVGRGAAVGALSLVKESVEEFTIVAGNPLRRIGARSRNLLECEARLRRERQEPGGQTGSPYPTACPGGSFHAP